MVRWIAGARKRWDPTATAGSGTAPSYLAGVGASGTLLAASMLAFVMLVVGVFFDSWPRQGGTSGASVVVPSTQAVPPPASGGDHLVSVPIGAPSGGLTGAPRSGSGGGAEGGDGLSVVGGLGSGGVPGAPGDDGGNAGGGNGGSQRADDDPPDDPPSDDNGDASTPRDDHDDDGRPGNNGKGKGKVNAKGKGKGNGHRNRRGNGRGNSGK